LSEVVEHYFRHEYGKLVASLSRKVGMQHIELVEDAVQFSLLRALESWTVKPLPSNPSAWLFKVAYNRFVDEMRQNVRRHDLLENNAENLVDTLDSGPECPLSNELQDDLLRMLFVVCHQSIPIESQLVFALKTLCGFSVREVALRLFISEANVYKRLSRARDYLKSHASDLEGLTQKQYLQRLPAVNKTLYLLFTEGYLSSNLDFGIRQELCHEAVRLTTMLSEYRPGACPETFALLALMHLHVARLAARQHDSGSLLLLEQQDRSQWSQQHIQIGLLWLEKAAKGDDFSRYHAEAGIAAEHCLAPSFGQTRWSKIVEYYSMLEHIAPSAMHTLNRAIAVAEWRGSVAGLNVLNGFEPPRWLSESYLWSAVLADLHKRSGHNDDAEYYRDKALALAPTSAIKKLLHQRLCC